MPTATESIFEKGEGVYTKVSGTLDSIEPFTNAKGQRMEIRLSPATLTVKDGGESAKEKFTFSAFVNEGNMGWRGLRDQLCVLGKTANVLDIVGRAVTFDIVTRNVPGKDGKESRDFTDYKPVSVSEPQAVAQVTEEEALARINGKTPAQVLGMQKELGAHYRIMSVKPALLKQYPNRVTIGSDGRYSVTS